VSGNAAHPSRRTVVAAGATALVAARLPRIGFAQASEAERHGLSTFGDLKYPADFRHFDYVNPAAPKGGTFSHQLASWQTNQNPNTFNTLNIYVLKGDGAAGMPLTFDPLMVRALDEPDALYGLVARAATISADGLTYRFLLRPEARFHDGSPLTARDVAFSLNILRDKGHPQISQQIRAMAGAEAEGEHTLVVRFAEGRSRDLPLIVAGLPIFSARYYETRSFEDATLDAPLGSGPYRVGRFEPGRTITFERVADYWAKDLPANVGLNNFERIRYEYYRDREAAFQGFTAGQFLFREEFTSTTWMTRYDFPALRDGRVKRETIPDETPSGAQGWFINTRRGKFKDRRVREALIDAFDFEWTNASIMFGQYARVASFFENSPMKAAGKPTAEELALLEPLRGNTDPDAFAEPYVPPVSDGSGQDRTLLRRASQLLQEAGLKRGQDGLLRLPNGDIFTIEFLDDEGSLERHTNPFIKNLRLIGIDARFRIVDPAQYQRRLEDFDFDLTVRRYSLSPTPGEAMRQFWGSQSAATRGSFNLSGIAEPGLDMLIDKALAAKTRDELTIACRCIDRVLRAGRYWVPMWHKPAHWLSYWDMFDRPAVKPKYDRGVPAAWWYDDEKAKRIGKAG